MLQSVSWQDVKEYFIQQAKEISVSDNVTPVNNVSFSSGTLPAGLDLVFVDGEDGALSPIWMACTLADIFDGTIAL